MYARNGAAVDHHFRHQRSTLQRRDSLNTREIKLFALAGNRFANLMLDECRVGGRALNFATARTQSHGS